MVPSQPNCPEVVIILTSSRKFVDYSRRQRQPNCGARSQIPKLFSWFAPWCCYVMINAATSIAGRTYRIQIMKPHREDGPPVGITAPGYAPLATKQKKTGWKQGDAQSLTVTTPTGHTHARHPTGHTGNSSAKALHPTTRKATRPG